MPFFPGFSGILPRFSINQNFWGSLSPLGPSPPTPVKGSSFTLQFGETISTRAGFFLRFRFGDRKEILRDRLEEFVRPFSIDVISGHYILRDRWRNLRDRFGPSKHLKKNTAHEGERLKKKTKIMNVTPFQPERVGNVENKNNSPVNIKFFVKTSNIRNFSQNYRSDVKTAEVATLLVSVT